MSVTGQAGAVPETMNLADGEWHRMHPLTPVVRSWRVLVIVLVFIVQDWGDNVVRGEGLPDVHRPDVAGRVLAGGTAVIVAVLAIGVGYAVLSWRATRFRVARDGLELH